MEEKIEIYKQLRTSQDKYTYFLLAIAAGAVAYSIRLTIDFTLSYKLIPLGIAVLCWGASFFFGCRQLSYINSTLYANFELFRVQRGEHPDAGTHPQIIAAASSGIMQAMESNSEKASLFAARQFHFLITGSILFLAWHLLEMLIRTI